MNLIQIYKDSRGKETFVPQGTNDPSAVIACDRSFEVDYEHDRLIMPSIKHDPEFRASAVTTSARYELFGFKFMEDNGFQPDSPAGEAEPKQRKRKQK